MVSDDSSAVEHPVRRLRRETVYANRHFKVVRDRQALPDGSEADWELTLHGGAVHVLPVDDDGYVFLVEQYRPAIESMSLEVPSGKPEPGEDALAAAARELREEAGLTANLRPLRSSLNGVATFVEPLSFFIGRVTGRAEPQLDSFERHVFRGVRRMPLGDAVDLCLSGGITQTASCCVILLAHEHVRRYGLPT